MVCNICNEDMALIYENDGKEIFQCLNCLKKIDSNGEEVDD